MKNCECPRPNLMTGKDDILRCQLCGGLFTETKRFEMIKEGYEFPEGSAWFLISNGLMEKKND